MAEFVFGIGSGLRAESPEILLKGAGVDVIKTALFRPPDLSLIEKSKLKSYFGTQVFDEVIIQGGNFTDVTDPKKPKISYETLTLQAVLLEVTQSKNIVTTALQGRNGTVKEFISDGDFAITMTGLVVGEMDENNKIQNIGNFYPEADVKKLIAIVEVSDALTITSNFLQLFGINKVVITDSTINQLQGTRSIQPFQILMLSDVPIQLNELET